MPTKIALSGKTKRIFQDKHKLRQFMSIKVAVYITEEEKCSQSQEQRKKKIHESTYEQ